MSIYYEIKKYFDIEELVCKHIRDVHGEAAWRLFDPRLLQVLLWIRKRVNKPIYANWYDKNLAQRGIRCNLCQLVKDKSAAGKLYVSPHIFGAGVDFDIEGMLAEESRQWIDKNKAELPFPVRLERNVTWVHLDVLIISDDKVTYINP
jgi:hypothetical protein